MHYLTQQTDHFFGFDENLTFQQRYLVADQHWKKDNGPILFYTGNEGDITWFCNNTGFMWDVAEELNAMLVFAEYRYSEVCGKLREDSAMSTGWISQVAKEELYEMARHDR